MFGGKWQEEKACVCLVHSNYVLFFWMFSICSWIPVCKASGYGRRAVSPYMVACIIVVLISSWVAASVCPLGLMYLLCILQIRKMMLKELKWLTEGHAASEGQSYNLIRSSCCQGPESSFWYSEPFFGCPWHGWFRQKGTSLGCMLCLLLTILYDRKSVGSCNASATVSWAL